MRPNDPLAKMEFAPPLSDSVPVNQAISFSRNLAELVRHLEATCPAAARQIVGKSLIGSRTVWSVPAAWIAGWLASRGLGLGPDGAELLSGLLATVAVIVMRLLSHAPITRIL